jgi:hydrogenase-4 component E
MGGMRFGQIEYDLAHLLGGGILLLSFVLLYQRRLSAVIGAFAVQGGLLALAAAWQGWVQGAPGLYTTAAMALVAKAILIPLALRRLIRRLDLQRGVETAMGVGPSLIGGVALVALAMLVVLPVTAGRPNAPGILAREDLALALSVVLLGMLMVISRKNALTQVVGLMSLENGLILAAISVAGMPLVVELSTAGLVLMLAFVAGLFVLRIRERFDTIDVAHLQAHRGEAVAVGPGPVDAGPDAAGPGGAGP